jgi:alkylated DNA repair dioxygenase AlkB
MWTQAKNILPHGGEVYLFDPFFTARESEEIFAELLKNIEWKQEYMTIYGRQVNLPRLTAWYGNEGKCYRYSGIFNKPLSWTDILLDIKQFVEDRLDLDFNSALLNLYRNQTDSIGWHSDNEPELGINPVIASLSFGGSRIFQFRHKKLLKEKVSENLQSGSLLIMQGDTQTHWLHRLSKSTGYREPRINITFRKII